MNLNFQIIIRNVIFIHLLIKNIKANRENKNITLYKKKIVGFPLFYIYLY